MVILATRMAHISAIAPNQSVVKFQKKFNNNNEIHPFEGFMGLHYHKLALLTMADHHENSGLSKVSRICVHHRKLGETAKSQLAVPENFEMQ
jgi:hypothetical protein